MKAPTDLLIKIASDIERVGWSAVGVFSGPDDAPGPPFVYTVGLRELGHPELIVLGLSFEQGHGVLATCYDLVAGGARFADGGSSPDVLQGGYEVRFRALPPDGRPANMARAFYRVDELEVLQVVWPDPAGLFPGDAGCDAGIEARQDLAGVRE